MPDGLALLVGAIAGVGALFAAEVSRRTIELVTVAVLGLAVLVAFTPIGSVWVPLAMGLVLAGRYVSLSRPEVLVLLGAAVLAVGLPAVAPLWLQVVTGFAAAGAAFVLRSDAEVTGASATLGLGLISCAGIYAAAPDTEQITVVGVAVGIVLVVGFFRAMEIEVPFLVGLAIMWAAGAGSAGRPAAMIGCLGCLGVLWFIFPVQQWARSRPGAGGRWLGALTVAHVVTVAVSSRVAGLQDDVVPALVRVVPAVLFAGVATVLIELFIIDRRR